MAGNYPDAPSWRMAYDVDGTQVFHNNVNAGTYTQLSESEIRLLNDEDTTTLVNIGIGSQNKQWIWIFPELRDIDAIMANWATQQAPTWSVSADTTNGIDGTWTTISVTSAGNSKPGYRDNASVGTSLGVKALRFAMSSTGTAGTQNFSPVHIFGEPSPGENLQRLEIWHPTLDQRLGPADLDWGDVPRNTTEIREFRIKNMHPTLTANSVRAAMSILTDTTPSVVGQQAISQDGGSTWGAQQTLSSPLGPEAISSVLQLRRQTPSNAVLSLWWYRLFADCSSWT